VVTTTNRRRNLRLAESSIPERIHPKQCELEPQNLVSPFPVIPNGPDVIRDPGCHRGCDMQRLVHAARVVKREPHGDSSPVIFKCFAESIRQSGEPPDAAVALGRKGGKKGGPARAASMTTEEQSESAGRQEGGHKEDGVWARTARISLS
jgi:hypothetical protein